MFLLTVFLLVPVYLAFTRYTHGAYVISLPGKHDTWNIQHVAPCLLSIVALFAVKGMGRAYALWVRILGIMLNVGWLVLFGFAVYYLWGEKV
jgi:hypothetical protein